jgi:hypothetical protein
MDNLLYDTYPIHDGIKTEMLYGPEFFSFALEYTIRKIQENGAEMKLNGTYQLLAYADDGNLLHLHKAIKKIPKL